MIYRVDEVVYKLSTEKLLNGLQLGLYYLSHVINGDHLVTNNIVSEGADLIIQLALFNGKLIYD